MNAMPSTLRQDPELGPLFDDLEAALDDRGLDHLRPPSAPPPRPGPRWWWWAGGVGVAVLLLTWSVWRSPEEAAPEPILAPVARVAHPAATAPPVQSAPGPAVEAPAPIVVAAARAPTPPPDPVPQPAADPVLIVPELVPDPPSLAAPVPTSSPVVDGLAAEERLYRPAAEALAAGDWSAAVERSGAYLHAYPGGRWAEEARLLELSARVGAGDWAGVEALAAGLDELPELASRHGDLLVTRAEALAALGRCPEALALVVSLPKKASAAVRRSCE